MQFVTSMQHSHSLGLTDIFVMNVYFNVF